MKTKISALVLTIFTVTSFFAVYAQGPSNAPSNIPPDVTTQLSPTCQEVLENLDQKLNNYKVRNISHMETYQILFLKLESAVSKAQSLGYDTQELETDLEELETLISEFEQNYEVFINTFESVENYSCDNLNEISYAQTIINSKKALGNVRETALEISNLYEDEIRENLLGLKITDKKVKTQESTNE